MKLPGPIGITDIMKILPHTYPFLLVDRVLEVNFVDDGKSRVGSSLRAVKNVTMNEPHFTGHFPGNPIMPGVLIIEAMAQAAAMIAYRPRGVNDTEKRLFYMMGVDNARWRRPVVPGDQMILELKMVRDRGTTFVFEGRALVGGDLAAEAELMARMV